jgi:hypothetical protein
MFVHSTDKVCKQIVIGFSLGLAATLLGIPKPSHSQPAITCSSKSGCSDWRTHRPQARTLSARRHRNRRSIARVDANGNAVTIIGGRPAGCPHSYCGCGLRKYLGLSDKRLNLAWNWARLLPRTHAHAGVAAVRHHHVMLLVSHVSGSRWTVRDYNSGNGLSRIHERSVSGYVFVNPRAETRFAKQSTP